MGLEKGRFRGRFSTLRYHSGSWFAAVTPNIVLLGTAYMSRTPTVVCHVSGRHVVGSPHRTTGNFQSMFNVPNVPFRCQYSSCASLETRTQNRPPKDNSFIFFSFFSLFSFQFYSSYPGGSLIVFHRHPDVARQRSWPFLSTQWPIDCHGLKILKVSGRRAAAYQATLLGRLVTACSSSSLSPSSSF
jgi:hypothetical protein